MRARFRRLRNLVLCFALVAVVLPGQLLTASAADGLIVVEPPECVPTCPAPIALADQLTVRSHRVDVTIDNQVATTRIDQVFYNPHSWIAEGTYIFPIPEGASVGKFTMWVDGEPIQANLLDAAEARRIYDDIVRRLRDPALLEYVGTGAIQASVFPIPAGEERKIEIEYDEVLSANQGLTHYVYPLNTERFSSQPLELLSLRVAVTSDDPIRAVYSPTHDIALDRTDETSVVVGFEESGVTPTTDFELFYSGTPDPISANLISSYDAATGEGHFMLLAAPGIATDTDSVVAKDVIVVLDTSGSMEGEKIEQAKEALTFVLEHLNAEDRFNVIEFSTGSRIFETALQPASTANAAADWVSGLPATGGTDINLALLDAMSMVEPGRPTMVLFLTDGLPSEGVVDVSEILSNVESAAPENVRLFSFGVGDDVDTILLDSLSQAHHGASTYVRPGQALDEVVSGFYAGISAPVLTDLSLDFGEVHVEDLYPTPLPDLFAGTQLVVVGRYRAGGEAAITLSGTVNGEAQNFVYTGESFATSAGADFVPRLWATRKIGYLLNQIRLQGEDPELVSAIVDLSVRYGIVTPYTSYLITEDDIFTQAGRDEAAANSSQAMQAPQSASGAAAVDEAEARGRLADADVAAPVSSSEGADAVRIVGPDTFVLRDGVWMQTTYDPSTMTPQAVKFASDEYFQLLEEHPELADSFALGQEVIAISGGQAYQVVPN